MKNIIKYSIFFLIIIFTCCNIDWKNIDNPCANCYNIKPVEGILEIQLSVDDYKDGVPIIIYIDEYEHNKIEYVDTAFEANYEIWVPVNQYYSVRAEYIKDNDTIYAFDGDNVRIVKESSECDEVCWRPKDGEVDLRLKY
ncbi:hypothetical protein ACFLSI_01495 [Bacteroidota bacterium]